MRLSIRVGTAALLILAIFLIKRHLDTVQDDSRVPLSSFWRFGGSSAGSDSGNQDAPVDKTAMESDVISPQNYETTPIIVPNDRALVMAKLASEDTSWVANDLNEWRNVIYTVDDLSATRHTPINKGRESLAYLQYIIEHYHDLPSLIVFIHSHKDGWPAAWHTDNMEYSNVVAIRNLQADFVQQNATPISDARKHPAALKSSGPYGTLRALDKRPRRYAQAWKELFNNTEVPEVIGAPCCSQFAVSRDQVLKRSFEDICSIIIGF
ncbi:hypothetical protein AARAC_009767 [Aspergillus arachidicola]|uniref:Uncharacterized protein n=1 Tax=Aspergillus arachidicola TaxID=656916 RepID=A0A2G7FLF2_9EURO|nr:hypothetical protein AARAC_009767 [Aspergillus arachidicola]